MSQNPFLPIIERFSIVFADRDHLLWAYVPVLSGCVPLRSPLFREHFFATSLNELGIFPSNQQFAAILSLLAGKARTDAWANPLPFSLPRRIHEHFASALPDRLRIHLQNLRDQYIDISPSGFETRAHPQQYFEYAASAKPLPTPVPDPQDPAAPLELLRQNLNLASHADWLRCLAWLLACFRPSLPAPLAIFQGPPSSGKSHAACVLRAFVDPSTVPLTPTPTSVRELYTQVRLNFVLVLDHISGLSARISDALCRLSSGLGLSQRQPRADPILRTFKRPVIITATERFTCPEDLAERALTIHFAPLAPGNRCSLDDLEERLLPHHAAIMGAICTALSTALRRLPEIGHQHPHAWILAAAPAIGATEEEIRHALGEHVAPPSCGADTPVCRVETLLDAFRSLPSGARPLSLTPPRQLSPNP